MSTQDIITEGYNAAYNGKSKSDNPYNDGNELYELWREGFDMAVSEVGFFPFDNYD